MKKILSVMVVMAIIFTSLFALTGCGNDNKKEENKNVTTVSYTNGKGVFTAEVPKKDDGSAKYEFTKEKPEAFKYRSTFYMETDNAYIAIGVSGLAYNTSKTFKEKHGDAKATFDGYLEWSKDPASTIPTNGMVELEINGRKAVRRELRSGSSGNYKYLGYSYMIAADDIYAGSYVGMDVYYKGDETLTSAKDLDSETQAIINSLKLSANK